MKTRFYAAMLLAALSVQFLAGCAAPAVLPATEPAAAGQTIPAEPTPLAPVPTAPPVAPTVPVTEPVPSDSPVTEATAPAPSRPASVYANLISKEEATAIALKDAGFTTDQVTRLRTEFDYDDGRPEYEVDFHQGGYEYDYEIHAETGKILSKDKDRED